MYDSFKIIDSHAHIFPEKIAERAVMGIGEFYGLKMINPGDSGSLNYECEKNGVIKVLVTSTATKPAQVKPINDFLLRESKRNDRFFPFGTVSPYMTEFEIESEIERLIEDGFYGLKLHPDFQEVKADSKEIIFICKKIAGKLPLLIHAGDDRFDYSNPDRLKNLIEKAPDNLVIIAAHLGGYTKWDDAVKMLSDYENLYVDTSSSLKFMSADKAIGIVKAFGIEKVIFGTDFPMWNHNEEINRIMDLGLPEKDLEKIFFTNANKLFFSSSL